MFNNLGFSEILVIAIVALVIFGPNKLPEMGRSVGQAIREFKKATQSLTNEVTKVAGEELREAATQAAPAKKEQPQTVAQADEEQSPAAQAEAARARAEQANQPKTEESEASV